MKKIRASVNGFLKTKVIYSTYSKDINISQRHNYNAKVKNRKTGRF